MSELISHWSLANDARDSIGANHGQAKDIRFETVDGRSAAIFNGRSSEIIAQDSPRLRLASPQWTIAIDVNLPSPMRGVYGDILSKFDPDSRCGVNLYCAGSAGAYCGMGDSRHIHFGIDDGYVGGIADCGRPHLKNSLATGLTTHKGNLYCGIADAPKPADRAGVYRYAGGRRWARCGNLGSADGDVRSVYGMIVHNDELYAATGTWDWKKCYDTAEKTGAPHVFRYRKDNDWEDLGAPALNAKRILTLTSYNGQLHAGVDKLGGGSCYRLDGDVWTDLGPLSPGDHCECLFAFGGDLYGATHTGVYRRSEDGRWTNLCEGVLNMNQIHSLMAYQGRLTCGTWPQGYVIRQSAEGGWDSIGRLGLPLGISGEYQCNEVMDMVVYNGKLYAGVIPKAQLYRYETGDRWTLMGSIASRPDGAWESKDLDSWSRITSFALHQGRLYMSSGSCRGRHEDVDPDKTLGAVYSLTCGQTASYESDIGDGWKRIVAQRDGKKIRLYVDGVLRSESEAPDGRYLHVDSHLPLLIGNGQQGSLFGALSNLKIFDGFVDPQNA